MTAYNNIIDLVNQDTTYTAPKSSASGTADPLFNDFTATTLPGNLVNAVMQNVTNAAQTNLTSLADIGSVVDPQSGNLEFQPTSGLGGASNVTLPSGQAIFQNAYNNNPLAVQNVFGVVQNNALSSAVPQSGVLGNVTNLLNSYLIGSNGQTELFTGDLNSIVQQQDQVQSHLTQINQQISTQVANFTQQMNNLNAVMAQFQAQSAQLTSLINGSNAALSSNNSSSTSSSG
jgi:flagellar hook-associated protein 2